MALHFASSRLFKFQWKEQIDRQLWAFEPYLCLVKKLGQTFALFYTSLTFVTGPSSLGSLHLWYGILCKSCGVYVSIIFLLSAVASLPPGQARQRRQVQEQAEQSSLRLPRQVGQSQVLRLVLLVGGQPRHLRLRDWLTAEAVFLWWRKTKLIKIPIYKIVCWLYLCFKTCENNLSKRFIFFTNRQW